VPSMAYLALLRNSTLQYWGISLATMSYSILQ
jgi:hypothetical protein